MSSVMSYPCGICNLDCIGYREIGCEHYDKWYHFSCENLKVKDFTFLSKTTLPYICSKCTYYSSSKQFNYDMALERLTVAARADRLEEAIKLELVFLRKELSTVTSPTNTISFRNLRTDAISSRLLGQTWDKTIPISVSADGNCLFNAFFPQATHILCTRHLKENARENLCKYYTQPIVSEILSKIVDAGGLLNAKGLSVYNELEAELQQAFNASPYLLNKLLPKLKSKAFMPRLNNANIPILWTNNNNEAYNNVIKQNQNWAVLKLPALINKLKRDWHCSKSGYCMQVP